MVEVRELVKRYPRSPVNAVDGVSFAVEGGEVFGLLGPNGAG
jgi:ABC-2 type transport system ATP-binding protein